MMSRLAIPQLAEATDREDDWTGLTDEKARRKRQNRLNVRAYRRRKAQRILTHINTTSTSTAISASELRMPCWVEGKQRVLFLPARVASDIIIKTRPLLQPASANTIPGVLNRSTAVEIIFPLSSDHLITLLQYNVLRASIANRTLFSACYPTSPTAECSTAALHILPSLPLPDALPASLHPTALQRTIPHEGWVDIIPHPIWRDNVLLALGSFDEDELWADTIGSLFDGFPDSEVQRRGIIAWSPPWHVSGWEISEGFLRKWAWTFKGCEDVLEATNRWRRERGEAPLVLDCV